MPRTTPVSVASRFIGPPFTLQARTPHTIRRARGVARALRERRCTPRPRVPPNLFPNLDCEAPVVLARSDRPTSKCAFQPLSPVRNWYNPHTPSLQVLALSDCLPHPPPGLSPCPVCRIVVPLRHLAKPESVSVTFSSTYRWASSTVLDKPKGRRTALPHPSTRSSRRSPRLSPSSVYRLVLVSPRSPCRRCG